MKRACRLELDVFFKGDLMLVNDGGFAEQLVGQKIVPIEVKSGSTSSLRSLRIFMEEKKINLRVRISEKPLLLEKDQLSLPFYMIENLPRLLKEYEKCYR